MSKMIFTFKRELQNLSIAPHYGEKKAELLRLYRLFEQNDYLQDLFNQLTISERQQVTELFS